MMANRYTQIVKIGRKPDLRFQSFRRNMNFANEIAERLDE
jgi:hypothetical protein